MTTEAPAPQLLSDEQIGYVQSLISGIYPDGVPVRHYDLGTPREYILEHSGPAYIADLLVDRAAFRLQVAEQLKLLLTDEAVMPMLPPADRTKCFLRNIQVKNAAKALNIPL